MESARTLIPLVAAAAVGLAAPVQAQPCATDALTAGTLQVGGPADFGQIPEACPARELSLRTGGSLLLDRPDFYGAVAATGTLRARYEVLPRLTASVALDALTWRFAANAVVDSSNSSVGPATLGAAYAFVGAATVVAPHVRLLWPWDGGRRHSRRFGGELGLSWQTRRAPRLLTHGGLTLPLTLTTIDEVGHAGVEAYGLYEALWSARPWLALGGGASARFGFHPRQTLRALAARLSATAVTGAWRFGLGAEIPAVGSDRTDLYAGLLAATRWR